MVCYNFSYDTIICEVRTAADEVQLAAQSEQVQAIWPNGEWSVAECQQYAPWHLGDISNNFTQARVFAYDKTQIDSTVYIIDSWVDTEHPEFEGRAERGFHSADGQNPHGTHVAGLVGSKTYGVNKRARLVSVQVLNERGSGAWSQILAGLDWVNKQKRRGAVINMSVGGAQSAAVDAAVAAMTRRGWNIVAAAGNSKRDACTVSPAGAPGVVTVGAKDQFQQFAAFSNYGPCVELLAPGVNVESTYPNGRAALMSGTSMAAPIVAGVWSTMAHLRMQDFLASVRRDAKISNLPLKTVSLDTYIKHDAVCGVQRRNVPWWRAASFHFWKIAN